MAAMVHICLPVQKEAVLKAMATVHTQFERMLWRFPEYFPFTDAGI